jgi:hypothetical protein
MVKENLGFTRKAAATNCVAYTEFCMAQSLGNPALANSVTAISFRLRECSWCPLIGPGSHSMIALILILPELANACLPGSFVFGSSDL